MKKIILSFILLSLLTASCDKKPEKPVKQITKGEVVDSLLQQHKPELEGLLLRINSIKAITRDLDGKLIVIDDYQNDERGIDDAIRNVRDTTYLHSEFKFNYSDCIFIHKASDLSISGLRPDSITAKNPLKFNLQLQDKDNIYTPEIWSYFAKKEGNGLKDQIQSGQKELIIKNFKKDLQILTHAKYIVFVEDLYFRRPVLVDDSHFETGMTVSCAKVFNAENKNIGNSIIFALNSKELTIIPVDFDNLKKKYHMKLLEINLSEQRNDQVFKFLNRMKKNGF